MGGRGHLGAKSATAPLGLGRFSSAPRPPSRTSRGRTRCPPHFSPAHLQTSAQGLLEFKTLNFRTPGSRLWSRPQAPATSGTLAIFPPPCLGPRYSWLSPPPAPRHGPASHPGCPHASQPWLRPTPNALQITTGCAWPFRRLPCPHKDEPFPTQGPETVARAGSSSPAQSRCFIRGDEVLCAARTGQAGGGCGGSATPTTPAWNQGLVASADRMQGV